MEDSKKMKLLIKPKYVSAEALINYWCEDDVCKETLKHELILACENSEIVWHKIIEKDVNKSVVHHFATGNLLINRESFEGWALVDNAEKSVVDPLADNRFENDIEKLEIELASVSEEMNLDVIDQEPTGNAELDRLLDESDKWMNEVSQVGREPVSFEVGGEPKKYANEKTYLLIIAILLEFLVGKYADKKLRNDAHLKEIVCALYDNLVGISNSTLNHQFTNARKFLKKKHDAKANEEELLKEYMR